MKPSTYLHLNYSRVHCLQVRYKCLCSHLSICENWNLKIKTSYGNLLLDMFIFFSLKLNCVSSNTLLKLIIYSFFFFLKYNVFCNCLRVATVFNQTLMHVALSYKVTKISFNPKYSKYE